jgi:hypothetical protein
MRVHARGCAGQCGQAQGSTGSVGLASGTAGHRGWPGYAAALPRADAPGEGLPAARSAPRAGPARDTRRNGPREPANAQTVNGREHQGDEGKPQLDCRKVKAPGSRVASPLPAVG